MNSPIALDIAAKSEFRNLKVVDKVRESSIISSFYLEPVDPDGWRTFQPGQFLVFRIPVTGEQKFVLRNYSISCSPAYKGSYRITVKREAALKPGLPNGLSSCYLHDDIEVGESSGCDAAAVRAVGIAAQPAPGLPVIYLSRDGGADYRVFVQSQTFTAREAAALLVAVRGARHPAVTAAL